MRHFQAHAAGLSLADQDFRETFLAKLRLGLGSRLRDTNHDPPNASTTRRRRGEKGVAPEPRSFACSLTGGCAMDCCLPLQ